LQASTFQEDLNGEVRQISLEERRVNDATPQEGNAQERLGTESYQPETGDRDRPQRSAREGSESTLSKVIAENVAQGRPKEEVGIK
jgi:hypothetical protein